MTEPGARRRRGRPRDPATDSAILTAALEAFIDNGVEFASIEQIARRAGVAKLTLYRRWSTKEELLANAIEHARATMPDLPLLHDEAMPLPQRLDLALDAAAAYLTDPRTRSLLARLIGAATSHPALLATYWKHYLAPRRALVRNLIDQAKREGLLPGDRDPEILMDMITGSVIYHLLIRPGHPTPAEMRDHLTAVLRQAGVTY